MEKEEREGKVETREQPGRDDESADEGSLWRLGVKKKIKNQDRETEMVNKHENTLLCFPLCGNRSPQSVGFIIQCQNIYIAERGAAVKSNLFRELFLGVFLI